MRTNPQGSNLLRQTIDEAQGSVAIVWDGPDGDFSVDDPAGLGGLDFLIYDTFEIVVTFSDIGGPVSFVFASEFGGQLQTELAVPGGIVPMSSVSVTAPLSAAAFGVDAATYAAVMGDVGGVGVSIDSRALAQSGLDVRFDVVRLTGTSEVPLPAAAWMLLAGVGGLGAMRMRRKAA